MSTTAARATTPFNVVLYYAGWLACVYGAAHDAWSTGAIIGLSLVIVHLGLSREPGIEVRLMLPVVIIGVSVDSLQTALGLLVFDTGQPLPWLAPLWIGVMWMLFSATLRYAFYPFTGRLRLSALLGAFGGPAAFWAGHRLGAVEFHAVPGLSLAVLALIWSALFPTLMFLARKLGNGKPGRYRFS